MITVATAFAFAGTFLGTRYLKKVTIGIVRAIVAGLMFAIGAALLAGVTG